MVLETPYRRPVNLYNSTSTVINMTKYRDDSAAVPKVAISSIKVDGDLNYLIDVTNELDQKIADIIDVGVPDGSITAAKLATDSVTTTKIEDSAVTGAKINDGTITNSKLASDSVNTPQILNEAITSGKIANAQITNEKIANNAVTEAKILDDSVTAAKLDDTGVTAGTYAKAEVTVDAQGRITTIEAGTIGDETVLWSGSTTSGSVTLSEDYNNFREIEFVAENTGSTYCVIQRILVSSLSVHTQVRVSGSTNATNVYYTLDVSGTTTVDVIAAVGTRLLKIVGVK